MKKIFAFFAIAALCLTGVSCVKELDEGAVVLPENGARVSLTVSDEAWVSTRSAYTPGEGVKMTKDEKIALFYDNGSLLVGNNSFGIVASPQGGGSYSFTAPEEGLDKTWYAIVPYSYWMSRAKINTNQRMMITFPSIQFPGQNTFDPQTDVLVAKPFTIDAAGAKTATIDAFKRLTAPFKLEITGLDAGEKIYAATFAVSKKASSAFGNLLAGVAFYNIGAEPDNFTYDAIQMAYTRSNDLSAVYKEGLVEEGGCWPVWFSVLPGTLPANSKVTVTVFTANACYTRSATINECAFEADKLHKLTFNIKGDGYTSVPAISQDFFNNGMPDAAAITTAATEKTVSLTATDGVARDWEMKAYNWTAAKMDGGSTLPNALGFPESQGASIKIPAVAEGNPITKVRLYLAPISYAETRDFPFEVYNGEDIVASYDNCAMLDYNPSKGYTAGGIIDIPCPEAVTSGDMTGLTIKFGECAKHVHALVSRIVLFTGNTQPLPVEGDYYQDFMDGKDIVIGNQTYNIKDDDIVYGLIEDGDYKAFKDTVRKCDILFIDNSVTITGDNAAGIVLTRVRPTAIVGRYKIGKGQPFIDMRGKFWQIKGGGMSLLNIRMSSTDSSHGLFYDAGSTVNNCLNIIDCTIDSPHFLYYDQAQEAAAVTSYIIDNSIIAHSYISDRACYFIENAAKTPELCPMYKKFSVTNTVFYNRMSGTKAVTFRCFVFSNLSAAYPSAFGNHENLEFTFKNNSMYGFAPRAILNTSNAKSVVIDDNVLFGTYTGGTDSGIYPVKIFALAGNSASNVAPAPDWVYPNASNSSISGNTFHFTPFTTNTHWGAQWGGEDSWYKIADNNVKEDATENTVFGTCDVDKLYFPVNTAVVTNGAGATYATKLWQTW
ncbi:MAG: hypothetical protein II851_03885 [Bacteroidales bacterium]|jgi:hypothetical protein|nr:hypothetical protein [Bacteroidales bacterium]